MMLSNTSPKAVKFPKNSRHLIFILTILLGFLTAQGALPTDADNAATFYFQAFDELPDKTYEESQAWDSFMADPSSVPDEVREYLERCQSCLELAKTAAGIQYCDWGRDSSQGVNVYLSSCQLTDIRKLVFVIYGEALKQGCDGNQQTALEYGLILQQLAEHTGTDSMIVQLMYSAINNYAAKTIGIVLGYDPASDETLTGLQSQYVTRKNCIQAFFESFDAEYQLLLTTVQYDDILQQVREDAAAGDYPGNMETMTDDELLEHLSKPFLHFKNKMKQIIALNMSVQQAIAEIELAAGINNQTYAEEYPSYMMYYFSAGPSLTRTYVLSVRGEAEFAVLQSAIELYDILAQTGELPETLPDYFPKDPFTRLPFTYEITSEGFILSYVEQDSSDDVDGTPVEKEFKVPTAK